jgi:diaminohydroxyphosphoribosylaminopyrimidine deaminase/5-amino-6-(5-phosphoribosylamino)uracil reductase
MVEGDDIKFMERCLELAVNAEGMTAPNPMVGSVIALDGIIIGEGYHIKSGMPHAEVNAVNSVKDKSLLSGSTLYVNLEPCCHFGKTPPCTDFIISHSIPKIVIGTIDTSEKISGRGIRRLKDAGCEVTAGILENECRWINRRFFSFHEKRRPYIILKWAQSADGFIDKIRYEGHRKGPNWISGKPERSLVHRWRASEGSILAGAGTIRADNPMLNVRNWTGRDPLRLVLTGSGNLPDDAAVFRAGGETVIFTSDTKADYADHTKILLEEGRPAAHQIVSYLFARGIQSLLIEGGSAVLNHFITEGLWDEARVFRGETYFSEGIRAPSVSGKLASKSVFAGSTLETVIQL